MSGHSVEEIKKETRVYILVFVALAFLTLVTVGVSYLHLSFGAAVGLALFIASTRRLRACWSWQRPIRLTNHCQINSQPMVAMADCPDSIPPLSGGNRNLDAASSTPR